MTWFLFAIFALFCFVAYDLLSRKISVDSVNPTALSIVFNAIVTLMTPILLLVAPLQIGHLSWPIVLLTLCGLFAWTLFARFEYHAHKHVEASTLGIVEKLAPALVLVYAATILGESLSLSQLIGIVLIIFSNIYLIWVINRKKLKIDKGIFFALAVAVLLSIGWTIDKVVSPFYGVVLFSFLSFGVPSVVNALTPPVPLKSLKIELSRTGWRLFVLAFLNLIAYAAFIKALMLGEASRVTPITTGGTPLVVLLSAMFLGEKDHLWKKLAVAGVTVVGIFLLS